MNVADQTVDLICGKHDKPLELAAQRALLTPNDPTDFSAGWEFDLSWMECPDYDDTDENECSDSWEVRINAR